MINFLKKAANYLLDHLPGKRYIVFESVPLYADNTRPVYEEMIRRGIHKRFRMVWVTIDEKVCVDIPHAQVLSLQGTGFLTTLKRKWVFLRAVAFVSCNMILPHYRKSQYAVYLTHGAVMKRCVDYYTIGSDVDSIVSISSYLRPYEAADSKSDVEKWEILGFPRNDVLFHSDVDVHRLFPETEFEKLVYWMPTFRQHKSSGMVHSTVTMPLLYNEQIAQQINECARANKVMVVVKPHFAQDVSRIKEMNLSNLRFIDEAFLKKNGTSNYAFMGKSDALLTDYSSVLYDFLLLNRPIGLCWDDFEEYSKREGFAIDVDTVFAGGEKLFTPDDLCAFLQGVAEETDPLKAVRTELRNRIHDHQDDKSTVRVTDYIIQKMNEKGFL